MLQKEGYITVTIPKCHEHAGRYAMTIHIKDTCPVCGGKRAGKIWKGFSYDGSLRLEVDCWENECGHLDTYAAVRDEYYRQE